MFLTLPADSPANLTILGYAALFVLAVLLIYILILIAALIPNRSRPEEVGTALFTYLMLSIAVAIMSLAGLTAVIGVLAALPFPPSTYIALLIVFAGGGFLFLRFENRISTLDSAAAAIPALLYRNAMKLLGMTTTILSAFTLLSLLLLRPQGIPGRFWVNPLVLLLYGTLLVWSVRSRSSSDDTYDPFAALAPSLLTKKRRK